MAGTRTTCSRRIFQGNEFGPSYRNSLSTQSAWAVSSHAFLAGIPKAPVSSVIIFVSPRSARVLRPDDRPPTPRARRFSRAARSRCFLRGRQQNLSRFRHAVSEANRGAKLFKVEKTSQADASLAVFWSWLLPLLRR